MNNLELVNTIAAIVAAIVATMSIGLIVILAAAIKGGN